MYILLYAKNFFENLIFVLFIPTICLIPAIIIYGILGKVKKDYSKLKKYIKWWLYSLVPVIITYLIWVAINYKFYEMVNS
ncbi:MAG: hypothetical protein PHZ26_01920 [Candidatus Gracilibacteria bacterium]|nr:hypothetical protein [Candidatus Gracilibacteria bacterium]MDD2908492.1 hypothetical protein [Candidatus Gracilibacteria bacterium]